MVAHYRAAQGKLHYTSAHTIYSQWKSSQHLEFPRPDFPPQPYLILQYEISEEQCKDYGRLHYFYVHVSTIDAEIGSFSWILSA